MHRILHYTKNFDAFKDSDFDKTTFGCRLSGQFVAARYNAYNREFKIRANLNKDGATCHRFCIRCLQKKKKKVPLSKVWFCKLLLYQRKSNFFETLLVTCASGQRESSMRLLQLACLKEDRDVTTFDTTHS